MERKRILLAHNEPEELEELRKALITYGYEVRVVDDGAEALKLCREVKPHLVLSQLELKKVDGHHLLQEIKSNSHTQGTAFLLVTKHRSVSERVHSIGLGIDDYVTTPFDVQELVIRIENILKEIDIYEATPKGDQKGFSGKLSELNLVELLQTLEIGKKSAIIRVQRGEQQGMIFMKDGELLNASLDDLPVKPALFRLFTWSEGTFRVELKPVSQENSFSESTDVLLSQGMFYRDQWDTLLKPLPPLDSIVSKTDKNSVKVSPHEKELLSHINGHSTLIDLIEHSELDDLQALQLAKRLLADGVLALSPKKEEEPEDKKERQLPGDPNDPGTMIARLITNFLDSDGENGSTKKQRSERRRNDRRGGGDRRRQQRRWEDFIVQENLIYLNKSELIMFREKLLSCLNGNRRADDNHLLH
jgi:CheY-like chemotaxis protein